MIVFADSSTPDLTGPTDPVSILIGIAAVALIIAFVIGWASVADERRKQRARRRIHEPRSHVRLVRADEQRTHAHRV